MTAHPVVFRSGVVAANDPITQRHDAEIELILPYRSNIALPNSSGLIRCLSGSLWVTRNNDATDHVIEPGHSFRFNEGEKIVVQGIRRSRLALSLAPERQLPFVPCT
jgi:hypothetical protein